MPHLPQAALSRVGHQDMAHHPCGRVPSVPGLVGPEEVDAPVEIGLQVPRRHPREAPEVALELGAQVVHHLHPLQVDRVVDVCPVRLALEPAVPDQHAVRPLEVLTASPSSRDSSAVRPATSAPRGFALPIWIRPIRPTVKSQNARQVLKVASPLAFAVYVIDTSNWFYSIWLTGKFSWILTLPVLNGAPLIVIISILLFVAFLLLEFLRRKVVHRLGTLGK